MIHFLILLATLMVADFTSNNIIYIIKNLQALIICLLFCKGFLSFLYISRSCLYIGNQIIEHIILKVDINRLEKGIEQDFTVFPVFAVHLLNI